MIEPNNLELRNALRRLSDSVAGEGASNPLETTLLEAFRSHHSRPKSSAIRRWGWIPAAIAASLMALVVWRARNPETVRPPSPPVVAKVSPPAPTPPAAHATEAALVAPVVHARAHKARLRKKEVAAAAAAAAVPPDEFVEIPYAPSISAYDGGQVVRVNMPGASARRLGLPVSMDRVQADVLLGNDGIARAIRLVSNSGLN